jgi:hypothetical protein
MDLSNKPNEASTVIKSNNSKKMAPLPPSSNLSSSSSSFNKCYPELRKELFFPLNQNLISKKYQDQPKVVRLIKKGNSSQSSNSPLSSPELSSWCSESSSYSLRSTANTNPNQLINDDNDSAQLIISL